MDTDWAPDGCFASEIGVFLCEFQQLEISVPHGQGGPRRVAVHVPYMQGSVTFLDRPDALARLKPRHRCRLRSVQEARKSAPAAMQSFLQEQFRDRDGSERPLAAGRGEAGAIRLFLQAAVDRGLVPAEAGSHELRAWLKRYGVGVDCSAFVQQALARLLHVQQIAVRTEPEQERVDLGFVRTGWVYRDVTGSAGTGLFERIQTPAEACVGDVLVKPGHMRLVAGVERLIDGAVVLHLMESTSAADIPCGQTAVEDDIGPRRFEVKYPAPVRPIDQQVPRYRLREGATVQDEEEESRYVLGRLRALGRRG